MPKQSAEILLYRLKSGKTEVLLVHPGGPYWPKKDLDTWSIAKGEIELGENLLEAAIRETQEETRLKVQGEFISLKSQKQKSVKIIHVWAVQGAFDVSEIESNYFEMEWPPKSSKKALVTEIDKAAWFDLRDATLKLVPGQIPFILELEKLLQKLL